MKVYLIFRFYDVWHEFLAVYDNEEKAMEMKSFLEKQTMNHSPKIYYYITEKTLNEPLLDVEECQTI